MKILRYLTVANRPTWGVWEEDSVRVIAGDPFGVWAVSDTRHRLVEITRILSPVDPPDIIGVALNYPEQTKEWGAPVPQHPHIFFKSTASTSGRDRPIILPKSASNRVDFGVHLALVIGKPAFEVSEGKSFDYLLGYTLANDISARDDQVEGDHPWSRGKSFDSFCPMGPFIETDSDPDKVTIKSRLNGELMQEGSTKDLIFSCRFLVSFLSHRCTLRPGTVILTGTPAGGGAFRDPPAYLKEGDIVEIEADGVDSLSNHVVNAG